MKDNYIFFWNGIYSQWYFAPFVVDGVTYNCAEQYMMAQKALLFNDTQIHKAIMASSNPAAQKVLGREVANFNVHEWENVAREVVYRGNYGKFSTHPELKQELLASYPKIIVEASPYDAIWGIGLGADHPDRFDESKWKGRNWLGKEIMRVRETLRDQNVQ